MREENRILSIILKVAICFVCLYIWGIVFFLPNSGRIACIWANSVIWFVSLSIIAISALWYGRKQAPKKEKENATVKKSSKIEILKMLSMFILTFSIQIMIVWNVIFRTGWDPGAIWYGSHYVALRDQSGMQSMSHYFSIHPHNLFLVFIYSTVLKVNNLCGTLLSNGLLLLAIVQCFLTSFVSTGVYVSAKKIVSQELAWLAYGFCFLLVGTSGWIMIPYSDASGVFFPTFIFWLYLKICEARSRKFKIIGTFFMFLVGVLGFKIKPMVAIVLIAIVIVELFDLFSHLIKKDIKMLNGSIIHIGAAVLGITIALNMVNAMIESMRFPLGDEVPLGWKHYLMLGFNEESIGGYSQEDFEYSTSFSSSYEQQRANEQMIMKRINCFDLESYIHFFNKKTAKNFLDGSFGWGGVGDGFYEEIFPERDNALCPVLRSLYYDNIKSDLYDWQLLIRQIHWFIVLICAPFIILKKRWKKEEGVLVLSVLGLMLYLQLFEAHPRYVYTYVPLYIVLAIIGYDNIIHKLLPTIMRRMGKSRNALARKGI